MSVGEIGLLVRLRWFIFFSVFGRPRATPHRVAQVAVAVVVDVIEQRMAPRVRIRKASSCVCVLGPLFACLRAPGV